MYFMLGTRIVLILMQDYSFVRMGRTAKSDVKCLKNLGVVLATRIGHSFSEALFPVDIFGMFC